MRQEDVAVRAGVSRRVVQRIEAGDWRGVTFGIFQRAADTLGARFYAGLDWNGAQLDRLVDAGHAELQNAIVTMLRALGWLVAVEASFNHYGDRGRYDVLAYHPLTGIILVVEVKTAVGDVQATLGTLDVKVRLAPIVARQHGWSEAVSAVPALVLADERQQHRVVRAHEALFWRFALRGRAARAWLKRPATGAEGLLLNFPLTNARQVSVRAASPGTRVRRKGPAATSAPPGKHLSPNPRLPTPITDRTRR